VPLPSWASSQAVDWKIVKPRTLASLFLTVASLGIGLWALKNIQQPSLAKETQRSHKSAPARDVTPNRIFSEMIPSLLRKTVVPLRLPQYVPNSDDKETPLYTILEVAEPERYSIQLAWIKIVMVATLGTWDISAEAKPHFLARINLKFL